MTHGPLTVSTLTALGLLADAVERGNKIARILPGGDVEWGVARAFTHDGGGFLGNDDVRDGFVWVSGGNRLTERWWPVAELLPGVHSGEVSTNYSPPR